MPEKKKQIASLIVFFCTWPVAIWRGPLETLWPVVTALFVVVSTRRALWGLLAGAFSGAVILSGGNPWQAYLNLFAEHLAPSLESSWKVGAILFTLILGGFAAVLNEGGGFRILLYSFLKRGGNASVRYQASAAVLGILCFFDGLANSMMVGRVCKELAEKCGVSRVKLSYIADSTSSAVACIAFISTWIAYQLTMIQEGYRIAGMEVNPYLIFVRSLPFNFYCWFTFAMLFVSIFRRFNIGPMRTFENDAARAIPPQSEESGSTFEKRSGAARALIPLVILILSFFVCFYLMGSPSPRWPISVKKLVAAFGSDAGPLVLVLCGIISSASALVLFPPHRDGRLLKGMSAFMEGAGSLVGPVFILIAAWMLGSVLDTLGTARYLSALMEKTDMMTLVPSLIFITGSIISFSTGTSWGTMGIVFPLAIPMAATACREAVPAVQETFLQISVAAVFSGAVFGDHCSPFSDTTIVSSISCGVEPHDHIRTQIPFALLTSVVAILFGFLPAGFGMPPFVSLIAGTAFIILLPGMVRRRR